MLKSNIKPFGVWRARRSVRSKWAWVEKIWTASVMALLVVGGAEAGAIMLLNMGPRTVAVALGGGALGAVVVAWMIWKKL